MFNCGNARFVRHFFIPRDTQVDLVSGLCSKLILYCWVVPKEGTFRLLSSCRAYDLSSALYAQGLSLWMDSLEPVSRMSVPYQPIPPPPPADGPASLEQLRLMLGKRIYRYNTVNPSDFLGIKLKEVSLT